MWEYLLKMASVEFYFCVFNRLLTGLNKATASTQIAIVDPLYQSTLRHMWDLHQHRWENLKSRRRCKV